MNLLTSIIVKKIEAEGPISVADYMALALGHPEHGYYRKQDPLGLRGDFITAPEISQIFGEMIGVWCAQVWRQMGEGPISLVELGPGRGTLMNDLLRATKTVIGFHESITIHMVETSPVLANAQYMLLRNEHPRIEWLDSIDEVPQQKMLLVANEFFDALPIKQFVMTAEGMCERKVNYNEPEGFHFVLGSPGLQLAKSGTPIPLGTVMEQSPASRAVMRSIAQRLRDDGGAALLIDYGYWGDAHHDTLQAVKAHNFHSVLRDPGEADITAHVDFTSLGSVARDHGLHPMPLLTQGEFLNRMGAQLRAEMLMQRAEGEQKERIKHGLDRLVSPQAMGELFKVLAVGSTPAELPGFGL
jgi:SAM-dependent MidA family methyltransferase